MIDLSDKDLEILRKTPDEWALLVELVGGIEHLRRAHLIEIVTRPSKLPTDTQVYWRITTAGRKAIGRA